MWELFVLFLVLKLTHIIDWSWWSVRGSIPFWPNFNKEEGA